MFTIGLLIFLAIAGMAFWILIFLASFIPLWITWSIGAMLKKGDSNAEEGTES